MAVGLMGAGASAYAFLIVADRALGEQRAAPLAAIWATVFLVGPGFFLPLEQEVSRAIAGRRAQGLGSGPLIARATGLGAMLAGAVLVICLALGPWMVPHLFSGEVLLFAALLVAIVAFFLGHLVRGVVSGRGNFWAYSVFMGAEGFLRLLIGVALVVGGVRTAGGYGMALALAPLLAFGIVASRQRGVFEPGPPAAWSELSQSMGTLLVGSVFAQGLANAGPIAVNLLADQDQSADVKRFFNGVIVARVPLFLFQAVQAALLPKLSALSGGRNYPEFRHQLRRLVVAVGGIGLLGTVAGFAIGPWLVDLFFNAELGRRDVGLLAAGTAFFIVAMSLAQALIALHGQRRMAAGWVAGGLAFVVVTALGNDLLLRVELASVVGSATAAFVMAGLLSVRLRLNEQQHPAAAA